MQHFLVEQSCSDTRIWTDRRYREMASHYRSLNAIVAQLKNFPF
jgi:hypothetical protein